MAVRSVEEVEKGHLFILKMCVRRITTLVEQSHLAVGIVQLDGGKSGSVVYV